MARRAGGVVDERLHVLVEQPVLFARILGVGRRAAACEVELEPAPRLWLIEEAVDVLALDLTLALEELGDHSNLLPGFWNPPGRKARLVLPVPPLFCEIGIGEHVGADVYGVAVAVDGDAMDLAVPRADRRLQIINVVVEIDLRLHHSGMLDSRSLTPMSPSKGAPISRMSKSAVPVAIDCCIRAL